MHLITLPPVGIPTTPEIAHFIKGISNKPLDPSSRTIIADLGAKVNSEVNPLFVKIAQAAFLVLRLLDLHESTVKLSATFQLVSGGYDLFYKGDKVSGALSLARAIAALMGYGRYLVIADIAATYARENDDIKAGQSFWLK